MHRRLRWKFRADMVCMIRFLRHPLNKMQLGKGQMAVQAPENYSTCRVNKKCSWTLRNFLEKRNLLGSHHWTS